MSTLKPAPAPRNLVALPGRGSVDLFWDPGPPRVLGYNVYRRGPGDADFQRLNARTVVGGRYRDLDVIDGVKYDYRITAVRRRND